MKVLIVFAAIIVIITAKELNTRSQSGRNKSAANAHLRGIKNVKRSNFDFQHPNAGYNELFGSLYGYPSAAGLFLRAHQPSRPAALPFAQSIPLHFNYPHAHIDHYDGALGAHPGLHYLTQNVAEAQPHPLQQHPFQQQYFIRPGGASVQSHSATFPQFLVQKEHPHYDFTAPGHVLVNPASASPPTLRPLQYYPVGPAPAHAGGFIYHTHQNHPLTPIAPAPVPAAPLVPVNPVFHAPRPVVPVNPVFHAPPPTQLVPVQPVFPTASQLPIAPSPTPTVAPVNPFVPNFFVPSVQGVGFQIPNNPPRPIFVFGPTATPSPGPTASPATPNTPIGSGSDILPEQIPPQTTIITPTNPTSVDGGWQPMFFHNSPSHNVPSVAKPTSRPAISLEPPYGSPSPTITLEDFELNHYYNDNGNHHSSSQHRNHGGKGYHYK